MPAKPKIDGFSLRVDREARTSLVAQIHAGLGAAIRDGNIEGGTRLPSWRDLAAQLGVARGTVRAAYERLADEQLIVGLGAAGTRVAERVAVPSSQRTAEAAPLTRFYHGFETTPATFQMGVPAQDAFPYKTWSRIFARAARAAAAAPVGYPDPRGHPLFRREIAAYLAVARGVRCAPSQVFVTAGFAGALNLAVRALQLEGRTMWMEEPGFPLTRMALERAGIELAPVPVDDAGLDVAAGTKRAPRAAAAIVTPGQQAPLGMTLSLERRQALLQWARHADAWILEDDYLSELKLYGRAAPALASLDRDGRVLHLGTFSKNISPALRLGFLVVPPTLAERFGEVAALLAPAPDTAVQRAVAEFMSGGHFLRHLRHMKRLYSARSKALVDALRKTAGAHAGIHATGGFAVRLDLPARTDDVAVAAQALAFGLAPVALSPWYVQTPRRAGLLLGVTNLTEKRLDKDCARLIELIEQHG
ncbi:MAG: PLP-dependent aminotransferase family protein [Rudaea sp.]|uniref:MocR-like pyridoxine biosynthesis transcription factor PdxR n=1 Tax=unclassified Rudaea TaxID=2627037 RepID=UPI001AC8986B|nr:MULTISPECIES: PLP-dependent aminotransferase family protein [unclassified Rudaea]MBN8885743.1 PLP-dependent aminotransferase family protein [Rudaea sp.]